MDYDMRGAGEWEPTENPNRLTGLADPFILDSLGSGMDGWNQSEVQIAQAKPGNGPQRND